MKLPRLITRRRAKWVGLLCVLIVGAVYLMAAWLPSGLELSKGNPDLLFEAENGAVRVRVSWAEAAPLRLPRATRSWSYRPWHGQRTRVWPEWSFVEFSGAGWWVRIDLPIWIPFLLIAAPTAWLWRTDRRAKPWQCAKCRYDLRGLDGGVCPECGKPTGREA